VIRSAPGLAPLLIKEMRFRNVIPKRSAPQVLYQRNADMVIVNLLSSVDDIRQLRLAMDAHVCPVFGRYKISRNQLDKMAEAIAKAGPRRLVASVAGSHFDRREITRWLWKQLLARRQHLGSPHLKEVVWLFCVDEAYYFCIPFFEWGEAPGRAHRRWEREGSLPPTIAAAMAFTGMPGEQDVVLDPVCGSGTLIAETAALAPRARFIGSDIDKKSIEIARANLRHIDRLQLLSSDSRFLPLPDHSVTLVLGNLPFGKQFSERSENFELYQGLLEEIRRLGAPGGCRGVFLTSDSDSFIRAVRVVSGLCMEAFFKVTVRGERARTWIVRPT